MKKQLTRNTILPFLALVFIIPLLYKVMSVSQLVIVSGLTVVIFWWATGAVSRIISSFILLLIFFLFGNTPVQDILYFPLSESFILVICSLLLAEGITNSRIALQIAKTFLNKWVTSPAKLIAMSFVLGIVLIFVIPHPFPRVIILSAIFKVFLSERQITGLNSEIFLFSIFVAGTCTPMLFLNGDFVLNYATLSFAQLDLTWQQWALYMAVPGLVSCALIYCLFLQVYRRELREISFNQPSVKDVPEASKDRRKAYAIIITVMILWITEPWHGLSAALVALGGVGAMLIAGLLKFANYKKIKLELLLNLTAVFAIGKVLKASGITALIQQYLIAYLPTGSTAVILLLTVIIVMIVHMMLGSCLTSMSVTIPILIAMFGETVNPLIIALIAYVTVSVHYLLPFHHLTLVLGSGENFFRNKLIARLGAPMTILIFIWIFLVYLPWWKLVRLY